jgi:hypothetical protein
MSDHLLSRAKRAGSADIRARRQSLPDQFGLRTSASEQPIVKEGLPLSLKYVWANIYIGGREPGLAAARTPGLAGAGVPTTICHGRYHF